VAVPIPVVPAIATPAATAAAAEEKAEAGGSVMSEPEEEPIQVVLRQPVSGSPVRISIGTYPSEQRRPAPTKLDFLPAKSGGGGGSGGGVDAAHAKTLLQTELSQTLSRARLRQRLPDLELDEEAASDPPVVPLVVAKPPPPTPTPPTPPTRDMKALSLDEKKAHLMMELKARTESGAGAAELGGVEAEAPIGTTVVVTPPPPPQATAAVVVDGAKSALRKTVSTPVVRKPAADIQARMASLVAQATNGGRSDAGVDAGVEPNVEASISQSTDNRVTIQVNAYVPGRPSSVTSVGSGGGILKSAASASTWKGVAGSGSRTITFGKT